MESLWQKGRFKKIFERIESKTDKSNADELKKGFEPHLNQPLHYAACRGNLEVVRKLIETYMCDPQCKNVHGITPIHCACYYGRLDVVKYLINEANCDPYIRDKDGNYSLVYCTLSTEHGTIPKSPLGSDVRPRPEHMKIVVLLISNYRFGKCNEQLSQYLLQLICCCGTVTNLNLFSEKLCLQVDSYICSQPILYLNMAIDNQRWDVAKYLIAKYHDVIKPAMDNFNASVTWYDYPHSPFLKACASNNIKLVKTFIDHGICKPNAEIVHYIIMENLVDGGKAMISYFVESVKHPFAMNRYCSWRNESLLSHTFSEYKPPHGDFQLIKLLCINSIGSRDEKGNSPLHLACKLQSVEIVTYLTKDLKCEQSALNDDNRLPLHIACEKCNISIVKIVSSSKFDINIQDVNGNTPLHIACKNLVYDYNDSPRAIVCYLLKNKMCNLNIQNNQGKLPLHIIFENYARLHDSKEEILRLIGDNKHFNINAQDEKGNTPLHVACMQGFEAVQYLTHKFQCDFDIANKEGWLPLHQAGDLETLQCVGKDCTKIHLKNSYGYTPLHLACVRSNLEKVKYLVFEKGCRPSEHSDVYSDLPIHIACKDAKDIELLRVLATEQNVNHTHFGSETPLHVACLNNNLVAIKVLINLGCNMSCTDTAGNFPLHHACTQSLNCVKCLTPIYDSHVTAYGRDGNTPLHLACKSNKPEIVSYLIANFKCNFNFENSQGDLPLHLACDKHSLELVRMVGNCNVNHLNKAHNTALHIACKAGAVDVVRYLVVECQSNTREKDCDGLLPLHIACTQSLEMVKIVSNEFSQDYIAVSSMPNTISPFNLACSCGLLDVVRYLSNQPNHYLIQERDEEQSALGYASGIFDTRYGRKTSALARSRVVNFLVSECGYDPTVSFNEGFYMSSSSLFNYACEENNLCLMKALTDSSVDIIDSDGNTPLHYACQWNRYDIVKYLVERGCDQTIQNYQGELAFHLACYKASFEVVQQLNIRNSDLINQYNTSGDTPLIAAVKRKEEGIVHHLVENIKCDVNVKNIKGETALHISSQMSVTIVRLLHTARLDLNCQTKEGNTPLHITCTSRRYDVIEYLLDNAHCRADIPNSQGNLPLHIVASQYREVEFDPLVAYSVQKQELFSLNIFGLIIQKYPSAVTFSNKKGDTPLQMICRSGKIDALKILIKQMSINFTDPSGNTFLHIACSFGKKEMVEWLIKHGANPCLQNHDGNLPHHLLFTDSARAHYDRHKQIILFSFGYNSIEFEEEIIGIMKMLHISRLNQIQNTSGDTVVHLACRNGFAFVLQYLIPAIKHDATPSLVLQNSDGDTPLHIAALKMDHYLQCLKDSNPNIKNKQGNTPLHIACQRHNLKFTTALVEQFHSSPDIFNNEKELPIHIAASHSLNLVKAVACSSKHINSQNLVGDTPLHIACRAAKMDIVRHLIIKFKCQMDILNNNGDSPLHLLYDKQKCADLECLETFVPTSLAGLCDNVGNTLLHVACRNKNDTAISFLVRKLKVSANVPNCFGATPLHYACRNGSLKIVKLVIDSNPNQQLNSTVESTYKHLHPGDTPLHVACRAGKAEVVQFLLTTAHKESLTVRNEQNDTPLHVACNNNVEVVKAIVTKYQEIIDINAVNSSQNTPLHIACKVVKGNNIVSHLVTKVHCRCDIPNKDGNLPLHIACQMKNISNIKTLIEAMHERDLNWKNDKGNTALHELFRYRCTRFGVGFTNLLIAKMVTCLHIQNSYGELPIHLACRNLQLRVLKCFTSQINIIATTNKDNTVLHESCINADEGVLQHVVKHYEHETNVKNQDGDLPLHIACRLKSIKKVSALIDKTLNVNVLNNHGNAPIHELFTSNYDDSSKSYRHRSDRQQILGLLLKKYIDFTLKNSRGQTPLHCICKNGSSEELKIAVASVSTKLNSSIPDNFGNTALHLACQADDFKLVNLLLSSAEVNLLLKNDDGQTAIMLATNHEIIKCLIEHGADPQPLYEMHQAFFQRFSLEKPPPTPVKLLVIGHPYAGKTSLTLALQNETLKIAPIHTSGPTAGVVPTDFNSKLYGAITIYDFAGQPEYYANHDAVIHNTIKNIPPVVLLLFDLRHHKESIVDQIHFWCNFISNRCASLSDKPHMILIGSHADLIKHEGKNPLDIIREVFSSHECEYLNSKVVLKGHLHMNCSLSFSKELHEVRMLLKQSTNEIRQKGIMHFKSHCFYVLLLQLFKDKNIVTLGHVIATIKHMSNKSAKCYFPSNSEFDQDIIIQRERDWMLSMAARPSKDQPSSISGEYFVHEEHIKKTVEPEKSNKNPINLLSSDCNTVIEMCEELNEMGHIIFIKHSSIVNLSWLIIKKEYLLQNVLGPLLAPFGFAQSFSDCSTGVVPMSRLREHFGTRGDSTMLLTLLTKMEYCRELSDKAVLELITEKEAFSDSEKYLFFPSLVSDKRPKEKWIECTNFYRFGWLLQCSREGELFSARFIQVLLLRVVFAFALKQQQYDSSQIETYTANSVKKEGSSMSKLVLKRDCILWESGIHWLEQSGIDVIIDIIGQRTLLLFMQCPQGSEVQLVQRRSQIIFMIFEAKEEFCPKAKLRECFLHPSSIKHPLDNLSDCVMFSLPSINDSIAKQQPYVIEHRKWIKLDQLLYFEPYAEICNDTIVQLFDEANSHQQATDEIFFSLAHQLCHRYAFFLHLCHPTNAQCHTTRMTGFVGPGPERDNTHKLARLLMQIKQSPSGGTLHKLRTLLDQLSIYCGRQPPQVERLWTSEASIDRSSSQSANMTTQRSPLLISPKFHEISYLSRGGKTVKIIDRVANDWQRVAIQLYFEHYDISRIKKDHPNDCRSACSAVFGEWLEGKARLPTTWDTLIKAFGEADISEVAADIKVIIQGH